MDASRTAQRFTLDDFRGLTYWVLGVELFSARRPGTQTSTYRLVVLLASLRCEVLPAHRVSLSSAVFRQPHQQAGGCNRLRTDATHPGVDGSSQCHDVESLLKSRTAQGAGRWSLVTGHPFVTGAIAREKKR